MSFQSYHIMVGLGMFFIVLTLLAPVPAVARHAVRQALAACGCSCSRWSGRTSPTNWAGSPPRWAASLGSSTGCSRPVRPPRPSVGAGQILGSIIMFGLIYVVLFGIWLYLLDAKIKAGPEPAGAEAARQARLPGHRRHVSPATKGRSMTDMARGR